MPFKRVLASVSRRRASRPFPVQLPHPFDSPVCDSTICLRHIPLHIEVTVHTRRLAILPPEVWHLIFWYATDDDTRFTPIDFPARTTDSHEISFLQFPHSHSDTDVRLEYYLRAIQKKHTLLHVCTQWSKIALAVLYESIWVYKPNQAHLLANVLSSPNGTQRGQFIKRLHIETPTLERCSPSDLRTIVDHLPCLEIYTDYRSIRRNVYASNTTHPSSSTQLLRAIAHPQSTLRRLSWTNYDDISFHLHLSRLLANAAPTLEFLELAFCNLDIHHFREPLHGDPGPPLRLPRLRSLKVCLHDATLAVLSSWDMPSLSNVSIVAADFSYAGDGFCTFFRTHGAKLHQLELAHSSSTIEEHYLTIPIDPPTATTRNIRLAAWCPNLREFVCSADAEWNWQNPDWIAPHVLLQAHPTLQLIGIRDLDKRLYDDMAAGHPNQFFLLLSQIESLLSRESFPELRFIRDMSFESNILRSEAYSGAITDFWMQVVRHCKTGEAWLEDYKGMNVTSKDMVRAQVKAMMRKKAEQEEQELQRLKRNPLLHILQNN